MDQLRSSGEFWWIENRAHSTTALLLHLDHWLCFHENFFEKLKSIITYCYVLYLYLELLKVIECWIINIVGKRPMQLSEFPTMLHQKRVNNWNFLQKFINRYVFKIQLHQVHKLIWVENTGRSSRNHWFSFWK